MEYLLNKKISGLLINQEKDRIVFCFNDGTTEVITAVGDCCSKSWFEHFEGIKSITNNKIVQIELVDNGVRIETNDSDVILTYAIKFITDKGTAQIEMRNESNGYYGGNVVRGFTDQCELFDDLDGELEPFILLNKDF